MTNHLDPFTIADELGYENCERAAECLNDDLSYIDDNRDQLAKITLQRDAWTAIARIARAYDWREIKAVREMNAALDVRDDREDAAAREAELDRYHELDAPNPATRHDAWRSTTRDLNLDPTNGVDAVIEAEGIAMPAPRFS